jgi:hypothetical protein
VITSNVLGRLRLFSRHNSEGQVVSSHNTLPPSPSMLSIWLTGTPITVCCRVSNLAL